MGRRNRCWASLPVQVNVNLLRKDEDYTPPAQPKVKAFTGTAHKLSGDAGAGTSGGDGAGGPPPSFAAMPGAVTWEGADHSLPVTSIQLRLADGSRLRAEFNLHHTVADIRRQGGRARAGRARGGARSTLVRAVPDTSRPPEASSVGCHFGSVWDMVEMAHAAHVGVMPAWA